MEMASARSRNNAEQAGDGTGEGGEEAKKGETCAEDI